MPVVWTICPHYSGSCERQIEKRGSLGTSSPLVFWSGKVSTGLRDLFPWRQFGTPLVYLSWNILNYIIKLTFRSSNTCTPRIPEIFYFLNNTEWFYQFNGIWEFHWLSHFFLKRNFVTWNKNIDYIFIIIYKGDNFHITFLQMPHDNELSLLYHVSRLLYKSCENINQYFTWTNKYPLSPLFKWKYKLLFHSNRQFFFYYILKLHQKSWKQIFN